MSERGKIAKLLSDYGFDVVGPVIEDHLHSDGHVVFLRVSIDDKGRQRPSNYKINQFEKALPEELGTVTIVLINSGHEDIVNSIKSLLLRRFPDEVRNVVSSVTCDKVSVWIDLKSVTTSENSSELQNATRKLVDQFNMELIDFVNMSEMRLPSETICLSIIRKESPITVNNLALELKKRAFTYPKQQWLHHRLDRLRKKDLIVRQQSGHYVLTLTGLKAMGSGKNRRSPDVLRALSMARRRT